MSMFSMASMTDVIFLLLIFFMVTSTFVFPSAMEVNLPQSGQQTAIKPTTRIYIDKDMNMFATQGDYCWFQPASGSPKTLVDNREWVFRMLPLIHDCRIPTEMIPSMPDGSPASLNLRVDDTFVENFHWHQQARRYTDFVHRASQDNLLLLEFGIGYNTPGIIRLPFEQMAQRFPHTTLIRFNRDNPEPYIVDMPRFTAFTEDIATVINQL